MGELQEGKNQNQVITAKRKNLANHLQAKEEAKDLEINNIKKKK